MIVTVRRNDRGRYVVMGREMLRTADAQAFVRELAELSTVELDRGPLPLTDPVVAALAKARGWRPHDLGGLESPRKGAMSAARR